MATFKIIASRGGKIVFDERLEANTPREARGKLKAALGLESLTGLVYAITEIPLDLIREIVAGQMAGAVASGRGRSGRELDLGKLVASAVDGVTSAALAGIERRLAAVEAARGNGQSKRIDPLGNIPTTGGPGNEPTTAIPEPIRAILGPDWKAIKRHYRKARSVKQTAAQFDVSVNTLKARIRREGWGK